MSLGRVYRRGVGALQDYILAHVWFNLAASQGGAQAAAERDALAEEMSVEEQAEARKLWREWRAVARPAAKAEELTPALSQVESEAGLPPPRAIKEAQALLAQLGYAPGPADGMWGKRTTEAYQTFLRDAGLPMAETLTAQGVARNSRDRRAPRRGRAPGADRCGPTTDGCAGRTRHRGATARSRSDECLASH